MDGGKRIYELSLGVLSGAQIERQSEMEVFSRELYNKESGDTAENGCLDRRLGVSSKQARCTTCDKGVMECFGHFGHIRLAEPVFHVGFFKKMLWVLQRVCKRCGSVLLPAEAKAAGRRGRVAGQIHTSGDCFACGYTNGIVRKGDGLTVQHVLGRKRGMVGIEDLSGRFVQHVFSKISRTDSTFLGLDFERSRASDLLQTHVVVGPACMRPSVQMGLGRGSNEDDLTLKLADIVFANSVLATGLVRGDTTRSIFDDRQFLQVQCAVYINSSLPGVQKTMKAAGENRAGLVQRLSGKKGRFRGNLSGKRVDFTSRTVISPDPNLRINEVGVPSTVAATLTIAETVTASNIKQMRRLVLSGIGGQPGANYVQKKNGMKLYLKFGNRNTLAERLSAGDIVERHLQSGDFVLFNRQPSLHRLSIMSHRVVVLPHCTFRFNPCVCLPYNADFDGDEMNIHVPQTVEARAEAKTLLDVEKNILSPRSGQTAVALLQDMVTAAYLLTSKNVFYTQEEFGSVCGLFLDSSAWVASPAAILKPRRLWTGKQVVDAALNPRRAHLDVFLRTKTRSWGLSPTRFHPREGFLVVHGGELMCGRLDKRSVGSDTKEGSLVYQLYRKRGGEYVLGCLSRLSRLTVRWLSERGMSIGLGDVTPSLQLSRQKRDLVAKNYARCALLGKQGGDRGLVEAETRQLLNGMREEMAQHCISELLPSNAINIMQECGSKGSKINVAQMVGCVGQQVFEGARIRGGYTRGTLPHFKDTASPEACGFIQSSFFDGLSPIEFFFHAVSGREGIVDTAVKTAETGYMQRRLMKALDDLCVRYDASVRSSEGVLVQYRYGEDGVDPLETEDEANAIDFSTIETPSDRGDLSAADVSRLIRAEEWPRKHSRSFRERLHAWAHTYASRWTAATLRSALQAVRRRARASLAEPGTACGAIAGQSIGEPGTQMTLKTFHFAGVASMNITQGVPRLREIINATKSIHTPHVVIEVAGIDAAYALKATVDLVHVRDLLAETKIVLDAGVAELVFVFDLGAIARRRLPITIERIGAAVQKARKLSRGLHVRGSDSLVFTPHAEAHGPNLLRFFAREECNIRNVYLSGLQGARRSFVSKKDTRHLLYVEGTCLDAIRPCAVDALRIDSNDIISVERVFGIEAARTKIIEELSATMQAHAITVDPRHLALLADTMTQPGSVLGITRFGISKMKDSFLMLSSFEKTAEHLFDAAINSKTDHLSGVSEAVIVGKPVAVGTGIVEIIA
eukprot:GHVN01022799.1.p1 GENE.GHVN01022799.1~~GHVN01022799.1.p1  ORF type:complete len:1251 (+),score=87.32 GHVN01022799.1:3-3755(+)